MQRSAALKKNFLMEKYQLKEEQIFFSRDMSFAQGIQHATGGQGVDVALNSLSGDALQATFECVAPFGRFIELGKRDITQTPGWRWPTSTKISHLRQSTWAWFERSARI